MKGRIEWNNFIVNDVKGKREKMKQEPSAAERSNRAAILDQCHEPTFNLLLTSKMNFANNRLTNFRFFYTSSVAFKVSW